MEIRHIRRGSGEPLVLVHGIGSRAEVWLPILDELARRREVIAVDLPGFGQSPAAVERPTVERQAEALAGWLREQGIERPHVAGNSMGAGIALELARRGEVRSAVALAPVGFWTDKERRWCQGSLTRARAQLRVLRPVLPALAATPVGRAAILWQVVGKPWRVPAAECMATCDALLGASAFDEALALFDEYRFGGGEELREVPVTVVWGSRDRLLLPRQAGRARRALPSARHLMLRGAGHLPMWDEPGAVATAILAM